MKLKTIIVDGVRVNFDPVIHNEKSGPFFPAKIGKSFFIVDKDGDKVSEEAFKSEAETWGKIVS